MIDVTGAGVPSAATGRGVAKNRSDEMMYVFQLPPVFFFAPRLAHLKRLAFKRRLHEDMLLFVQEAEKLVCDKRWDYECKREGIADGHWENTVANLAKKGTITSAKHKDQVSMVRTLIHEVWRGQYGTSRKQECG